VADLVPFARREQTANCFNALIEGAWLEFISRKVTMDDDEWLWLVGQLEWVGDWGEASHMTIHHLTELHGKELRKIPLGWFVDLLLKRDVRMPVFDDRSIRETFMPYDSPLLQLIEKPSGDTPEARESFARLIDAEWRSPEAPHALPWLVARLDPTGAVVPSLVIERLNRIEPPNRKSVARWARFAGHYRAGTAAWNAIAEAVCRLAAKSEQEDPHEYYSLLRWQEPEAWWGSPDQVAPRWIQAVANAKQALDGTPEGHPLHD
jgi:hypothetical protein